MSRRFVLPCVPLTSLLFVAMLLLPAGISAQYARPVGAPDTLRVGDRVRLWARTPPLSGARGELFGFAADSLVILSSTGAGDRRADPYRVPVEGITRLEVNRPRSGSHLKTFGAVLLGGVAGTFIGGGIGYRVETMSAPPSELRGLGGMLIGALVGALGGAVTGGALVSSDRWVEVAVPGR